MFVTILACYVRTKWPHRNYLNRGIWHPGQGEQQKQWASVLSLRLSRRYRQQSFERETEEKRAHGLIGEYSFIWQLLGCRVKFRKNYYPVPHLSADLSFQPALERMEGWFSVKELREIRISGFLKLFYREKFTIFLSDASFYFYVLWKIQIFIIFNSIHPYINWWLNKNQLFRFYYFLCVNYLLNEYI